LAFRKSFNANDLTFQTVEDGLEGAREGQFSTGRRGWFKTSHFIEN
jgi:hypothetical protein